MQTIELTAKSVQEATKLAAEKLGTSIDGVNVTVLEETKGLFGKSSVRVRAETSAPAPEKAKPASKAASKTVAAVKVEAEPEPVAAKAPAKRPSRSKKAAEEPIAEPG